MQKRFKISSGLPPSSPPHRNFSMRSNLLSAILFAHVLLLIMASFLGCQPSSPRTAAPIVTTVQSPGLIAPKDYGMWNATLTDAIANLNRAELKFIRDAKAAAALPARMPGLAAPLEQGSFLDDDLVDIATGAMSTAQTANNLSRTAAAQDKGSDNAQKIADQYNTIAKTGYALVIEAQNLREPLQKRATTPQNAAATIAGYGARMYNVASSQGKDNPFTTAAGADAESKTLALTNNAVTALKNSFGTTLPQTWIATADTSTTRTLDVPAPRVPVANPLDPGLVPAMTTKQGEQQGDTARQVAAATLNSLGVNVSSATQNGATQVQVPLKPVAVAAKEQIAAGNVPSFNKGNATAVTQNNAPSGDQFLNTLFGLGGENAPTKTAEVQVTNSQPLVNLSLSHIVITNVNKRAPGSGTFEADVNFTFTVTWNTTLGSPQFTITCNSGLSNAVAQTSGELNLSANGLLILYPGNIHVYCYANSSQGQQLGSVGVDVLVGDAGQATQRANQVETDSASLNLTLTAEAVGTANTAGTQTAESASQTAVAAKTINALETEVAADKTAEFKKTADAFGTRQAQPAVVPPTPSRTPTFVPKVVDSVFHPGNIFAVSTKVALQRGRLYRFTFSGRVNLINPTRSVSANQLPDHVNGVAVSPSGIVVIEGTGGVATITCGAGTPDPKDPGGYSIVVEDLGPS